MTISSNLGYPRIGRGRELKRGLEAYWAGKIERPELERIAAELRRGVWERQRTAGIDHIPSNDFSYYDHVLDTCAMVGAVPDRFGFPGGTVDLDTYFAMARGSDDVVAMEMTKWFDTNYHYIVPEFSADQQFELSSTKIIDEFNEAKAQGLITRPVLLGPVSFLLLGKSRDPGLNPLDLLERILGVYAQVLERLATAGAQWVQIDEPWLAMDLDPKAAAAYNRAYRRLRDTAPALRRLLVTYFAPLHENLATVAALPVDGVHIDLVRAPNQLEKALEVLPETMVISAGVVDGRNIWVNDLDRSLRMLESIGQRCEGEGLIVGPSCSLLHVPIDLELERGLAPQVRQWLSFADQKLDEIATLTRGLRGRETIADELALNAERIESRVRSPDVNRPEVKQRLAGLGPQDAQRQSVHAQRAVVQRAKLGLGAFPTTTIGSFPQTAEVRSQRAARRTGKTTLEAYERFLENEIERVIRFQEEVGLDVLVHGEAERNDMVQYFGEQLTGYAFTEKAWVQSYGSRYVRPPIIYGDVSRPEAMTVRWTCYAASLTEKPVKGMLTGPITMLQWSFVRDDQPREVTARQIALAIRDEVTDLEAAGIGIVQIDEPALREGLPLRRSEWKAYLAWAVESFRLASSGVRDETQIHTHMCYSNFNDIIEAIGDMDADVISIEASRSGMELLDAFESYRYPNEIGPGVYDIHSPRVPSADEMREQICKAARHLAPEQIWVNPDCGLKTRGWDEVRPALKNMVEAARAARAELMPA